MPRRITQLLKSILAVKARERDLRGFPLSLKPHNEKLAKTDQDAVNILEGAVLRLSEQAREVLDQLDLVELEDGKCCGGLRLEACLAVAG